MFAFPLFLAGSSDLSWNGFATFAAWCFTAFGLVFAYWSAILYIPMGRRALIEGRAARAAAER
jgi:hypothetical protein